MNFNTDQHQQSQAGVKSTHPRSASEEQAFRFDGTSSRILHKESDLLPGGQYANKLSTKNAPYASETPVMITKRHLATATSYEKSNEINAAKIVAASVIRKTAKSASSKIGII